MTERVKTCYLPSKDMDTCEEVLQHHFQNFKGVVYNNMFFVLCFVFEFRGRN